MYTEGASNHSLATGQVCTHVDCGNCVLLLLCVTLHTVCSRLAKHSLTTNHASESLLVGMQVAHPATGSTAAAPGTSAPNLAAPNQASTADGAAVAASALVSTGVQQRDPHFSSSEVSHSMGYLQVAH